MVTSTGESPPTRRERAQLILIAAVIIAAFVISAIVLLNLLHESPEFATERDSQSITDSERISMHLFDDLHHYFLSHTSSGQVPYAEPGSFDADIAGYAEPYMNLSKESRAAVTSVEFAGSPTGAVVWKNHTRTAPPGTGNQIDPDDDRYLAGVDELPRMYFNLDDGVVANNPAEIVFVHAAGENQVMTINQMTNLVEIHGGHHDCLLNADGFEIDLTHGTGEIRSPNGYCKVDIRDQIPDGSFSVEIRDGNDMEWEYILSGTDASIPNDYEEVADVNPDAGYVEGMYVDPSFDIVYEDPNITYRSTIKLFSEERS